MAKEKIRAWWADQKKLNPYELDEYDNPCKNNINSLAQIECSIAVIVAFALLFLFGEVVG